MLEIIPGLNALHGLLKRKIERNNNVLAQRKELSKELAENCRQWAELLLGTFDRATRRWQDEGPDAGCREIVELEMDFLRLDYRSLTESSPVVQFLREDSRFENFAASCVRFYQSALGVKRIVYHGIQNTHGEFQTIYEIGLDGMTMLWKQEVGRMLEEGRSAYNTVKVIPDE